MLVGVLIATSGCCVANCRGFETARQKVRERLDSVPRIEIGELRTESQTIERGSADTLTVEIVMGAGELDLTGGAAELLEADFIYNVAEFKPEVDYEGDRLSVRQPAYGGRGSLWDVDDYRYEWNLRFNDDVRTEMSVKLGAGTSDLDLGSLSLTTLKIETGAGEVTLDLSGASMLSDLDVKTGAGQLTADLTGARETDLHATIGGGVGETTLRLPRDVGVRVEVERGLAPINADGWTRDGDAYVNDAFHASGAALRVEVQAGIGEINLELSE
jgi:hypothetical protein